MSIFKGSGVAIVTPFKKSGEVDYEQYANVYGKRCYDSEA